MDLAPFVGPAIRQHRQLVRISQEELAARSGLDRTYVSGVERGRRNPTVEALQKLANGLGSDLDVIFATARQIATSQTGRHP